MGGQELSTEFLKVLCLHSGSRLINNTLIWLMHNYPYIIYGIHLRNYLNRSAASVFSINPYSFLLFLILYLFIEWNCNHQIYKSQQIHKPLCYAIYFRTRVHSFKQNRLQDSEFQINKMLHFKMSVFTNGKCNSFSKTTFERALNCFNGSRMFKSQ